MNEEQTHILGDRKPKFTSLPNPIFADFKVLSSVTNKAYCVDSSDFQDSEDFRKFYPDNTNCQKPPYILIRTKYETECEDSFIHVLFYAYIPDVKIKNEAVYENKLRNGYISDNAPYIYNSKWNNIVKNCQYLRK